MPSKKPGREPAVRPIETIAEYAVERARISLDPALPPVRRESTLGRELEALINGYCEVQKGIALYLQGARVPTESLRSLITSILTVAARTHATTARLIDRARTEVDGV